MVLMRTSVSNHRQDVPTKSNAKTVEGILYTIVASLCAAMIVWIMIAPASWLYGRTHYHTNVLLPYLRKNDAFRLLPEDAIYSKYRDHSAIQFTHTVPGALWATIIPLQLHPTWRYRHRRAHRVLGYLHVATTLLMARGVVWILQRHLSYEDFFPDLPPERVEPFGVWVAASLLLMTLWHVMTLVQAVLLARSGRYKLHRQWMIRHVASGIWVAVQRFMVLPVYNVVYDIIYPQESSMIPRAIQRRSFSEAGFIAMVVSLIVAEVTIFFIVQSQRKKKIVD